MPQRPDRHSRAAAHHHEEAVRLQQHWAAAAGLYREGEAREGESANDHNSAAHSKTVLAAPDLVGNESDHPVVVRGMVDLGEAMEHLHLFNCWRGLWATVGRFYNDLDVWGGWCFTLGGLLFALAPWLHKNGHVRGTTADWLLMAGVLIFLCAKVCVELRAVYATFWERPTKRPGSAFHIGVLTLTLGGLHFLATTALDIAGYARAASWNAFLSSCWFLVGTFVFLLDGAANFKRPFHDFENLYFHGSLALFLGSVFFMFSSTCDLSGVRDFSVDPAAADPYRDKEFCSAAVVAWFNILGGVGYLVGGLFLLAFGYFELWDAKQGPDPRCYNHHGQPAPHPFRPREGTAYEHEDPAPSSRFPHHGRFADKDVRRYMEMYQDAARADACKSDAFDNNIWRRGRAGSAEAVAERQKPEGREAREEGHLERPFGPHPDSTAAHFLDEQQDFADDVAEHHRQRDALEGGSRRAVRNTFRGDLAQGW